MGTQGSVAVTQGVISCGSQALEHGGSTSCGALALVACGIRDQTHVPCIGRWIPTHSTTREVPLHTLKNNYLEVT